MKDFLLLSTQPKVFLGTVTQLKGGKFNISQIYTQLPSLLTLPFKLENMLVWVSDTAWLVALGLS